MGGREHDYEAARLVGGGLLQSVRCVLGMVQQVDGAGLGVMSDGGL